VHIYRLDLLEFTPNPPKALLQVTCSKGTYIRKLCHDIGDGLRVGAFASFMVRTRVGRYTLDAAFTLEELRALRDAHQLEDAVHSMDEAMSDLPSVDLLPPHRQAVMHGQSLPLFKVANWRQLLGARAVRLRDAEGLVALARVEEGLLKPFKVLRDS
jgi:tRNA pseudouridine55 synthase